MSTNSSDEIYVDIETVGTARDNLAKLAEGTIKETTPLVNSKGKSAEAEKEIIALLYKIRNEVIPDLCLNTGKLLTAIINEFQGTDETVASGFEETGETGSQVPHHQLPPGRS